MIKHIIDFLDKFANILSFLANMLRNTQFNEQYYVYLPGRDKPRIIHKNYKSARKEAERLYKQVDRDETVEILQIVNRFDPEIPF